jgi:4-amino-4-deoxy-L-arabinose transferase-like glycosyltransferase
MPSERARRVAGIRRRTFAAVFGVALGLRLLLLGAGPWRDIDRSMNPDSQRYLVLARNLIAHREFGKAAEDGIVHQDILELRESNGTAPAITASGLRPDSVRTPGYPILLAALLQLTGDLRTVLVFQCILGALIACVVMILAYRLGLGHGAAVIAGMVWAVHPATVLYDALISTESLFNAFTATALLFAGGGTLATIACGALLGAAGLVRPLGMLYVPAALALAALASRDRFFRRATVILVLAALPSGMWAARNWRAGEGFRVTTIADINLLYYFSAYTISEERGEDWMTAWPARVAELTAKLRTRLRPGEDVIEAGRALAIEELRSRPTAAIEVLTKSSLKFGLSHSMPELAALTGREYRPTGLASRLVLGDPGEASAPPVSPSLVVAVAWTGFNAALAAGALASLLRLWRGRRWAPAVFGGITITLFLAATGAVGLERMRLPVMLPLIVLAASCAAESFVAARRWAAGLASAPSYEAAR